MSSKNLDYPPFFYIIQILENCPLSIFVYVSLWKARCGCRTTVEKSQIQQKYLIDEDNFRKHLFSLRDLQIVFFSENVDSFVIFHSEPQISPGAHILC